MHLDIDHNKTTIWTVDEIDELIDDIDKSKNQKKEFYSNELKR